MLRKIFFGVLWFVTLNVGVGLAISAVAGLLASAGESEPQKAFELGRAAGASVAWLKPYVFIGSLVVSITGALMGWLPGTKLRHSPDRQAVVQADAASRCGLTQVLDVFIARILPMEKLLKVAVILGALLAGVGVFYHYVIFLPSVERQKIERAETEKREAANQEASRQRFYEACKKDARSNYSANWAAACEDHAHTQTNRLRGCLSDQTIITNPYMGENYCKTTFGDIDPSPDCSLPKSRSESINQANKDAQQQCLAEARGGL
jgi:hypothetical protein